MSMDGLLVHGSISELKDRAPKWRVGQVAETVSGAYIISFRGRGASARWAIDVNPGRAHAAFTERPRENLPEPPPFVMLLRKHLVGTLLADAGQEGLDRVIWMHLEGPHPDAPVSLGGGSYKLYAELFGRPGNLILTDAKTGLIIDARRRYSPGAPGPGGRIVWPGRPYTPPPQPGGINPLTDSINEDELASMLGELTGGGGASAARRAIMQTVQGIGPHTARDILYRAESRPGGTGVDGTGANGARAGGARAEAEHPENKRGQPSAAALASSLTAFIGEIRENGLTPSLARDSGGPAAWGAAPLRGHQARGLDTVVLATFGELMDTVLAHRRDRDRHASLRQNLNRGLSRARRRARRRLDARLKDLEEGRQADEQRRFGELLVANLHVLQQKPGKRLGRRVELMDPMDPEGPAVEVPLDPRFTPAQNSEAYFARYRRLKRKAELAARAAEKARQDLFYVDSLLLAMEQADSPDQLEEVAREAAETLGPAFSGRRAKGKGKRAPQGRRRPRPTRRTQEPAPPRKFTSRHGYTILVGRNNRQNDEISLRTASPHDVWVHVKDAPGAHVVIRQPHRHEEVPPGTIEDAAVLAAYFSGLRQSSGVPVDWTRARYVRKPKGSPPGMVIYEGHKTVFVTPTEEAVARLAEPPRDGGEDGKSG